LECLGRLEVRGVVHPVFPVLPLFPLLLPSGLAPGNEVTQITEVVPYCRRSQILGLAQLQTKGSQRALTSGGEEWRARSFVHPFLHLSRHAERSESLPPREAPRTVEIVVKSVFMGAVMQEERMLVDALSDEPVELTLVVDEQVKPYL
jgi:hypothetical protein